MEPPTKAKNLVARRYRSGGLAQVQRPGLPDANQPNLAKSNDGKQEADGREIDRPPSSQNLHEWATRLKGTMASKDATIGISDHGGWAVLVIATAEGTLLDRRRVELVDEDLPKIPHHSEAQRLPIDEAVALVERVRLSAEQHSELVLEAVDKMFPGRVFGVALRQCPSLPPTIAERIKDYRAQNNADWIMYRQALAGAAESRGWDVHWFDARKVFGEASKALRIEDLDAYFVKLRKSIGAPWSNDHKIAMAAAIVAAQVTPAGRPG